jgi:hypothetical protein
MAAAGFEGGDTFRLSAAAGAGALKLHQGDITLWSIDGATDAIVCASAPSHDPSPHLVSSTPYCFCMISACDVACLLACPRLISNGEPNRTQLRKHQMGVFS